MSAQLKPVRKEAFGGCPHDCPDTCAMIFEIEDGKLAGVRGNKEHPMTRGGLCVKLKDYEKRHYHPDRLLYPLRRTGPKGSKQYKRISWDEARMRLPRAGRRSSRNMARRRSFPTVIWATRAWCMV